MAHKKQGGKTAQGSNVAGKRLGIKLTGGQHAKTGMIILRQRGTAFHPGAGADIARDHTIFATQDGTIVYSDRAGRKFVSIQ